MISGFPNKALVRTGDIDRGDIVLFIPLNAQETQRGIVYSHIYAADGRTTGLLVLPLDTIGKKKTMEHERFPLSFITDPQMLLQAGANPSLHQGVVTFNLRTVVGMPVMTRTPGRGEIYRIGTYHGLPFMTELLRTAQTLYDEDKLYKDGKVLITRERHIVQPPKLAVQDTQTVRITRAQAHQDMAASAVVGKATPMIEKMPPLLTMGLKKAYEDGILGGRTILTLLHYSLEHNYFPKTLNDAFTLVTEQEARIIALKGPLLEEDDPKKAIENIKTAITQLKPKP